MGANNTSSSSDSPVSDNLTEFQNMFCACSNMSYLEDDKQREIMADQLSQRSICSNRRGDAFKIAVNQCSHRSDVVYLGADEVESGRGNYDAPAIRPSYNYDDDS